jgi:hypothetical protein
VSPRVGDLELAFAWSPTHGLQRCSNSGFARSLACGLRRCPYTGFAWLLGQGLRPVASSNAVEPPSFVPEGSSGPYENKKAFCLSTKTLWAPFVNPSPTRRGSCCYPFSWRLRLAPTQLTPIPWLQHAGALLIRGCWSINELPIISYQFKLLDVTSE